MIYLPYPIKGSSGCLSCSWYSKNSPCDINQLYITASPDMLIALQIGSRTKTGNGNPRRCPSSDSYIVCNEFDGWVDIMSAFQDNVWSSSTTITVYGASAGSTGPYTILASTAPYESGAYQETVSVVKSGASLVDPLVCADFISMATITVNSNGIFTIA